MRKVLVALAVPLLLLAGAGPAAAHAALVGTDPADGATVDVVPSTLTLTFNEVVGESAVVVTAPDGRRVSGTASSLDRTVSVRLSGDPQQGDYRVAYRVVSADGHPVSGRTSFTSTTGEKVTQAPAPQTDDRSFVHRHRGHIAWAVGAALVGVVLIVWPLLRRKKA